MGILRTDKISGLETPTAVTGSVSFDGTDDALIIADHGDTFDFLNSDFTVECWIYPRGGATSSFGGIWTKGQPYQLWWKEDTERVEIYASSDGSNYNILNAVNSGNGSVLANQWSHIAHTREGDTFRIFVNGILLDSTTSSSTILANTNSARIADYDPSPGTYELDGEISNLRVLKGTALYTADFTPPTHALEVIKDTVILCCNNPDSVTASAFAGIGTAYAITTAGNPTVATRDPGLTRDFTSGTEFKGVTTFDTQGYFVPPSGTTEQRGRGRGIFGGGDPGIKTINYITIASMGNAFDFGDLSEARLGLGSAASSTRALFAGGYGGGNKDTIDFVTIATTGNAVAFGELVGADRHEIAGASNSTRGLFAGGSKSGSPNMSDEIDYITIASLGDATDFGNLTLARRNATGVMSPTRAVFCGGRNDTPAPSTQQEEIDYVTIATTGNALDFGDLTVARGRMGSVSSSVRGVVGGGEGSPADSNVIDYITIASTGNAQDFGDMITASEGASGGCSNSMRGVFGGHDVPGGVNTMEYITISSTGNSQDFGDLLNTAQRKSGCSDSHGGLS
jgi:hypothetical protein